MDTVRFWGPRIAGKYWGPIGAGLTALEYMYNDTYTKVDRWASERGMKRKRARRDPIPPRLKQDTLKLPAKEAVSNNLNMSRGRARSRSDVSMRSRSRAPVGPVNRPRRRMKGFDGKYTGPFPFPNKRPKAGKTKAALKGSRGHHEGNVDALYGTNVAMIGFSSFVRRPDVTTDNNNNIGVACPMYHICVGILREMFKKTWNIGFERHDQRLDELFLDGTPHNGRIDIIYKIEPLSTGVSGSTITPTWGADTSLTLSASSTLQSLANNMAKIIIGTSNFGARGYVISSGVPQKRTLYGVAFAQDFASPTGTAYKYIGLTRLDKRIVNVRSTSVIYVQNQTTSDGLSYSTDVIDANPIAGKIFYFKDPAPKVKYPIGTNASVSRTEWKLMHDANADGVIYPNTTSLGSTTSHSPWEQIPTTDMFVNCSRYSSVSLAPGEMRKLTLKFKFKGPLQKFIEGHDLGNSDMVEGSTDNPVTDGNPSKYQTMNMTSAMGTSVLFAFEKRLSTGTNAVGLAVQRNVYASAILSGQRGDTLMPIAVSERPILKDDTTT